MKSFATACLASFAIADTLIQSGVGADRADDALTGVFMGMPGNVNVAALNADNGDAAFDAAISLNDWFLAEAKPMPDTCEAGLDCRGRVVDDAIHNIEEQWKVMLGEIEGIFDKSFTRSQNILETAYDAAKQCQPGCVCESITIEYADIIRQQKDLYEEITNLEYTEVELVHSRDAYIVTCPEYEYVHLGDETYEENIVDQWTTSEVTDTWTEESNALIDSTQDQSSDSWTMTGEEEVGTTVLNNEQVVGAGEGDWETVDTQQYMTADLQVDESYYPTESGYTYMA